MSDMDANVVAAAAGLIAIQGDRMLAEHVVRALQSAEVALGDASKVPLERRTHPTLIATVFGEQLRPAGPITVVEPVTVSGDKLFDLRSVGHAGECQAFIDISHIYPRALSP